MDLKKLDSVSACERGMDLTINDELDQPTDIVISIVGVDSATYRREHSRLQAKIEIAKKRGKPIEGEDLEVLYVELSAKCTTGWQNMNEGTSPVTFSTEKALEIYTAYPIIKSQVFVALYDRAGFLGNVVRNSPPSLPAKDA